MKNLFGVFVATLLAFISKVMLDVFAITTILANANNIDFLETTVISCFIGIPVMYLFNQAQRRYSYVYSVIAVFALILVQHTLFFLFPNYIQNSYFNTTIPAFVFIGNLLLFSLFDGLKTRLNTNALKQSSSTINYAKAIGVILAGVLILFLHKKMNLVYISTYYLLSCIGLIISLVLIIVNTVYHRELNTILESIQEVVVQNKIFKLAKNKYYTILLSSSMIIGAILYISFRLFSLNLQVAPIEISLIEILCYYVIAIGFSGVLLEYYFKRKLFIHLGVKGALYILPIATLIVGGIYLAYFYSPIFFQNKDWNFLFFIASIIVIGIMHVSFEHIIWPTMHNLYQPIKIAIRTDFYSKSFIFGLLIGIGVTSYLNLVYIQNTIGEVEVISILLIIISIIQLLVIKIPLYNRYKIELQNYLNNQSNKIIKSKRLFKQNEGHKRFISIQFVRYINLLNIINPVLSRKAISETINSEDNFKQRFSMIKAADFIMLDISSSLNKIKESKYFSASPNRDIVNNLINRFKEIRNRMEDKKYVDQLSISKKTNERVLGATLAFYCNNEVRKNAINRLIKDPNRLVTSKAIISGQNFQNNSVIETIVEKLDDPFTGNASFATLLSCGEIIVPILEGSFYKTGQTEKKQLRIIQLYGEIANEECIDYLIKKLNFSNQNIISASLVALSKCDLHLPEEKAILLYHEVEELCDILVWNMSMLIDIEKQDGESSLIKAMKDEIEGNYNNLFNLLSLLYDSKSIYLIQNNLFSSDSEQIAFALELAAVLFKNETKHLLLPLLQPISNSEKVSLINSRIPTESLDISEVYYILIQRDSKWINQWTKACAINELAKINNKTYKEILIANMINDDSMLSELASKSLYINNKQLYYKSKELYGGQFSNLFAHDVLECIESKSSEVNNAPFLKFDIITFLQTIPEFSEIHGEVVKQITNHIEVINAKSGDILEDIENINISNYFYVLYSGEVLIKIGDTNVKSYSGTCFISSLEVTNTNNYTVKMICNKDAVLYKIAPSELMELFTIKESIPESFVKHTNNDSLLEYSTFLRENEVKITNEKLEASI